ncbi:hypothetical protein HAX54_004992 [Datura stramonium]|uniref:Uncharacterized protein n=1 Tax=Datura stramonium TaxID=4076 RepID=A0ABS8T7Y5_DATST|nr:hypothetical protein [Datura stramonium]
MRTILKYSCYRGSADSAKLKMALGESKDETPGALNIQQGVEEPDEESDDDHPLSWKDPTCGDTVILVVYVVVWMDFGAIAQIIIPLPQAPIMLLLLFFMLKGIMKRRNIMLKISKYGKTDPRAYESNEAAAYRIGRNLKMDECQAHKNED